MINEPTAAAIFYALENKDQNKTILIFDFGGGTFDVSIVQIVDRQIIVKGYRGDSNMGGEDIDNALLTLFLEDCQVNHPNFDARENKKGLARLKKAAFDVKGLLSQENESEASADGISGDTDFVYDVTRVVFEERC